MLSGFVDLPDGQLTVEKIRETRRLLLNPRDLRDLRAESFLAEYVFTHEESVEGGDPWNERADPYVPEWAKPLENGE